MNAALLLLLVAGLLSASSGVRLRGWLASWKRDHSRLDRMPVYGKRGTHHGHRLPYDGNGAGAKDKRLALLSRMPESFEKGHSGIDPGFQPGSIPLYPSGLGVHGLGSNSKAEEAHTQPIFGKVLKTEGSKESDRPEETLKEKKAAGVLDRMPTNFGKRKPSPEAAAVKNETDEKDISEDKRAKLDRMPLNFGKRNSESSSENMPSGKLDRMPLTFGKRRVARETGFFDGLGGYEEDKRMAMLDRMPFAYGKRDELPQSILPPDGTYLGEAHELNSNNLDKRLGKLDRMPFAYGKREDGQGSGDHAMYPAEELDTNAGGLDKRLGKLDRMPFAYGKREDSPGSTEMLDIDSTEGMPVSFDKRHRHRTFGDSSEEKRIVKLDRMPLVYGKRNTFIVSSDDDFDKRYSKADSFPLNLEKSDSTATKRMAKLDRMPITFGKRQDVTDLNQDRNEHVRQLAEFEPILTRVDRRRAELAENIPIQEPSVPHKRLSKLDRMPLRFGKRWARRLHGGRRTRLAMLHRMPATFGKRHFGEGASGLPISRKSLDKLGRMPISYGKRSNDRKWSVPVTSGASYGAPVHSGEQFTENQLQKFKAGLEAVLHRMRPSVGNGPGPEVMAAPASVYGAKPEDMDGWNQNANALW